MTVRFEGSVRVCYHKSVGNSAVYIYIYIYIYVCVYTYIHTYMFQTVQVGQPHVLQGVDCGVVGFRVCRGSLF